MVELLLLLLPVAAASGWFAARRSAHKEQADGGRSLSPDYFQGLNYILNEQPDKAIEVFVRMLEVDSETIETHFALANLFRRRGEVDRAIRIHQNIIARPTLSKQHRAQALHELGLDYMRAGLLDRAEDLFQELIEIGEYVAPALRQLVEIYQQEKDWNKAIETVRKLASVTGEDVSGVIAQYYCELADEALHADDVRGARDMIQRAIETDPNCARASILLGELEFRDGNCDAAIAAYKQVERQDPEVIPEVIEPLRDCYSRSGRTDELAEYLRQLLETHEGITPMLMLADLIREQRGYDVSERFIIDQLRSRPSMRGLERLIEFNLAHTEGRARDNLLILEDIVKKLLENRHIYTCQICGFSGKTMHWLCPSCKSWNSVKPIQGVVGE